MSLLVLAGAGIGGMLGQPFMRNALLGGITVAAAAGAVGYFVVLRSQVFSGDALSHVAFTGALAALAVGLDARLGLFVATIGVGMGMALLGRRGRADDVVIGSVFAWVLGLGTLFLSLYARARSTGNGAAGVHVLFGSIFGLTASSSRVAAAIAAAIVLAVVAIARPLLFASLDEGVARARGVPVRALGVAFLALVGATAAEATQAVGALLLLGLMAAPAGAAYRLTARPFLGLWMSSLLAAVSMAGGLSLSYLVPRIPPSFAVIAIASGIYALALASTAVARPAGREAGGHERA